MLIHITFLNGNLAVERLLFLPVYEYSDSRDKMRYFIWIILLLINMNVNKSLGSLNLLICF